MGRTAVGAPLPPNAGSSPMPSLAAVACPSTASCVAVGYYLDSAGHLDGLLLTGLGSSWAAVQAPVPPDAATFPVPTIVGVACPAASTCAAVGTYLDAAKGNLDGLLLTGFGSSWQATQAPLPADGDASFGGVVEAVACPAATCVAAGGYNDSADRAENMMLTGPGSWKAIKLPLPSNTSHAVSAFTFLNAVTCSTVTVCVATGSYADMAGNEPGLLLRGHGSSWTAREAPRPAGQPANANIALTPACAPGGTCVAVGTYFLRAHADQHGLLLTGHGSSWTAVTAPLPANAGTSSGPGIVSAACPANATCIAVGSYTDTAGGEDGLLLTGPGPTWTAAEAPLPPVPG
jgi:hypothetical protein